MKKKRSLIGLILALLLLAGLSVFRSLGEGDSLLGAASQALGGLAEDTAQQNAALPEPAGDAETDRESENAPDPLGSYTGRDELALFIHCYGRLPDNFVTKDQAREAGWDGGAVEEKLPGMCIGGDRFGNREGLLPDAEGRIWTECDVNTLGASSRGAERIVFSNDGLIYYTGDHYESFELLYG